MLYDSNQTRKVATISSKDKQMTPIYIRLIRLNALKFKWQEPEPEPEQE